MNNELTKKDVLLMIKVIKANYSYAYQNSSSEDISLMANVWLECLKPYPKQIVNEAFKQCIQMNKYPPTVADITEQIDKIKLTLEKSEQELWAELDNAIWRAGEYYNQFKYTAIPAGETRTQGEIAREKLIELYNSLDEILKEYLSKPSTLISLYLYDDLEYEKGRFLKSVADIRKRRKLKENIKPKLLELFKNSDNALKTINDIKLIDKN